MKCVVWLGLAASCTTSPAGPPAGYVLDVVPDVRQTGSMVRVGESVGVYVIAIDDTSWVPMPVPACFAIDAPAVATLSTDGGAGSRCGDYGDYATVTGVAVGDVTLTASPGDSLVLYVVAP